MDEAQLSEAQLSADGTRFVLSQPTHTSQQEHTETLVFIHGVGLNHQVWQPQVEHFSDRYQILVYDMLGHGGSRQPSEDVALADYVAQLATLMDELAIEKATVIGHSMGALVSVAFALAHPSKVDALVAMNIVYRRTLTQREAVEARATKVLQEREIAGLDAALQRWFAGKVDAISLDRIDRVRAWMAGGDPIGYGRTYRLFAQSDDAFVERLHELPMPVLYLTGDADPNSTPTMSKQMATETPHGKATTIPNEAHMMAYISPEKVNPVLTNFLESN